MRKTRRLLLVEDNEDDAFLFCRAFRKEAAEVAIDVAGDGRRAMEYLSACSSPGGLPGLVLLDLQLPYFTGFEVLERVRQEERLKHVPVVILTSSTQPSDITRAYELRANSYLVKPGDAMKLTELARGVNLFWLGLNWVPWSE